jgi:hypothetical protein
MNDFDFYSVEAHSSSKRDLYQVGSFKKDSVKSSTDWRGRFPVTSYSVTIGYVDVMNIGHVEASKRADELKRMLPEISGVKYYVRFFPRD